MFWWPCNDILYHAVFLPHCFGAFQQCLKRPFQCLRSPLSIRLKWTTWKWWSFTFRRKWREEASGTELIFCLKIDTAVFIWLEVQCVKKLMMFKSHADKIVNAAILCSAVCSEFVNKAFISASVPQAYRFLTFKRYWQNILKLLLWATKCDSLLTVSCKATCYIYFSLLKLI